MTNQKHAIDKATVDLIEQAVARGMSVAMIIHKLDVPEDTVLAVLENLELVTGLPVEMPVDEPVDNTPVSVDAAVDVPVRVHRKRSSVPAAPMLDLSASCGHDGLIAAARDEMARIYGHLCPEHINRQTRREADI